MNEIFSFWNFFVCFFFPFYVLVTRLLKELERRVYILEYHRNWSKKGEVLLRLMGC